MALSGEAVEEAPAASQEGAEKVIDGNGRAEEDDGGGDDEDSSHGIADCMTYRRQLSQNQKRDAVIRRMSDTRQGQVDPNFPRE